jgi:hypothetical protein
MVRFDFEEVSKDSHWSMAALQGTRLEETADGLGRVSVLGNDGFKGTFFAKSCGELGAQAIQMSLGFGFLVML